MSYESAQSVESLAERRREAVGESRLTTTIDFERDGKQYGFLRLPHSVTRSAYGWLPVPLVCVRNGEGPTVLLMAGVHGDEFEGQVALSKLVRRIEPETIRGRVLILPTANLPAAQAGERVSPIDDVNLNRVFPGDPGGTVTLQLAHYIETRLMALADYVFDLHSGGSSLHYLPTTLLFWQDDPLARRQQIAFAEAFGTDFGCFFRGGHGGSSSSAAARRQGAAGVTVELGGSGKTSPDALRCCERGVISLLRHVGVLQGEEPVGEGPAGDDPAGEARRPRFVQSMDAESFVYATEAGVFEPLAALGEEVAAGQLAGFIQRPERPWETPYEVRFQAAGAVLCYRPRARVEPGDCLFQLGCPVAEGQQP